MACWTHSTLADKIHLEDELFIRALRELRRPIQDVGKDDEILEGFSTDRAPAVQGLFSAGQMRDPKYGHNSTVLVARLKAEKSKAEVQCAHCEAKGAEKSMMRCPFCGYLACMGCRSFIEAEKAKDYA